MKYKVIKTRKPRKCEVCERDLPVGSEAMFYSHRSAKMGNFKADFDPYDEGQQVGVDFIRGYHCLNDCNKPESCQKGEHVFTSYTDAEAGDVFDYCDQCLRTKDELPADGVFTYKKP